MPIGVKYFELHNRPKLFDPIGREFIRNQHSPAGSAPGPGLSAYGRTAPGQREQRRACPIRKGGYECGIYCNRDWYINVCGGLNAKYWIARYPAVDDGTLKAGLKPRLGEAGWQYSSKGKVSGIAGNVDLDIWYEEKA